MNRTLNKLLSTFELNLLSRFCPKCRAYVQYILTSDFCLAWCEYIYNEGTTELAALVSTAGVDHTLTAVVSAVA